MSKKIFDFVKPGVITGDDVQKVFAIAKENGFALPAVNCVGTDSVNAVLEAAAKVKAPVIVQFSNGGAVFTAGKGLKLEGQQAAIIGAISGAKHVHAVAEAYGVPVILHTDHAAKKLLPWIDGLLEAGEKHFAETGKPLFSYPDAGAAVAADAPFTRFALGLPASIRLHLALGAESREVSFALIPLTIALYQPIPTTLNQPLEIFVRMLREALVYRTSANVVHDKRAKIL